MEKKATPRKLFVERMRRQGRGKEWDMSIKQVMAEESLSYNQAAPIVMKAMGYEGPSSERAIHAEYEANIHKTAMERERDTIQAEIKLEKRITNFEESLRDLPPNAPPVVEMNWVAAHPAMMRATKSGKKVELNAEDVLYPPHGKAPSVAAVSMLQYWANNVAKFHEQRLSEQKKKVDEGAGSGAATEDAKLAEVELILKEFGDGEPDAEISAPGEGGRRSDGGADVSATAGASALPADSAAQDGDI